MLYLVTYSSDGFFLRQDTENGIVILNTYLTELTRIKKYFFKNKCFFFHNRFKATKTEGCGRISNGNINN